MEYYKGHHWEDVAILCNISLWFYTLNAAETPEHLRSLNQQDYNHSFQYKGILHF